MFATSSRAPGTISVANTLVQIMPMLGSYFPLSFRAIAGILDHVTINHNGTGLNVISGGGVANITVTDSVCASNSDDSIA